MKRAIIFIILGTLAFLFGYLGYMDDVKSFINVLKNAKWDIVFGWLIFIGIPGLLTILGIIWLIGFLFKIEKKLDE